jgi:hypothetical protein
MYVPISPTSSSNQGYVPIAKKQTAQVEPRQSRLPGGAKPTKPTFQNDKLFRTGTKKGESFLEKAIVNPGEALGRFRKAVLPKASEIYERKEKEARQSLLPTRSLVASIGEEMGPGTFGGKLPAKSEILTGEEYERFIQSPELDGLEPLPVARLAGVPTKILAKLASETAEGSVKGLIRKLNLSLTPEAEETSARLIARESDSGEIERIINNTIKQSEREIIEKGTIRFDPENPPVPKQGEEVVYFVRTPGSGPQFVTRDLDALGKQIDNLADARIEVGVVPKGKVKLTEFADKNADGIRVISQSTADDIVRKNRLEFVQPKRVPKKAREPRVPIAKLSDDIGELETQISVLEDRLKADPVKQLLRYVSRATDELPEITGKRKKGTPEFSIRGDEILDNAGFKSRDDANRAIQTYREDRTRLSELRQQRGEVFRERASRRRNVRIATSEMADRRRQYRALTSRYNLTPGERNMIRNRFARGDIGSLTENEFARFMEAAGEMGGQLSRNSQLRGIIRANIEMRNLQNVEALQDALKLPKLNDMTFEQLEILDREIGKFQDGDRFLGARLQETLENTDLKGLRTHREIKEVLIDKVRDSFPGKTDKELFEDLSRINIGQLDRYLHDAAFANQSPFHRILVESTTKAITQGNIRFARFEDELDDLVTAARNSRGKGIFTAVPTDKRVFNWLEADDATKIKLGEDMTPEELALGNFLRDSFAEARDHLLQQGTLGKYVKDYIAHVRRSGWEALKEDDFKQAFKEMVTQYKVDEEQFRILNSKTGQILPLEKFFGFAMRRAEDGVNPTQNVSRAAKAYFMAFERKKALDATIPEMDAYIKVLTPDKKTGKGLDRDPRIRQLFNEWLNNKRGRQTDKAFGVTPGSAPDVVIRGLLAATRMIDLGLSLPNFVAANVGEQVASYVQMGGKQYTQGIKRLNSKQGKEIVEKYRGVVGRSPWREIADTSRNLPDRAFTIMLAGFHDASVRANKIGLLGQLTEQELKTGTISPERLAQIKVDMNKWRALDNTSSIMGSTAPGKVFTQYKTWAVPIIYSNFRNLKLLTTRQVPLNSREGHELLREVMVTAPVALLVYTYMQEEPEGFVDEVIQKSGRDALSAVGAMSPEMWLQTPRTWQYLQDIQDALATTLRMEEYTQGDKEGQLKGPVQFGRLITPAPVRQIGGELEESEDDGSVGAGLPTLPKLPSATLPELPKLPTLPSL